MKSATFKCKLHHTCVMVIHSYTIIISRNQYSMNQTLPLLAFSKGLCAYSTDVLLIRWRQIKIFTLTLVKQKYSRYLLPGLSHVLFPLISTFGICVCYNRSLLSRTNTFPNYAVRILLNSWLDTCPTQVRSRCRSLSRKVNLSQRDLNNFY